MSTANRIEIYQSNSGSIGCTVTGITDVTGYDSVLTVKKREEDVDPLMSLTGTVIDPCTLLFNVSTTDSSLAPGEYVYDINISLDASRYTITKDVFAVLDGVKY